MKHEVSKLHPVTVGKRTLSLGGVERHREYLGYQNALRSDYNAKFLDGEGKVVFRGAERSDEHRERAGAKLLLHDLLGASYHERALTSGP